MKRKPVVLDKAGLSKKLMDLLIHFGADSESMFDHIHILLMDKHISAGLDRVKFDMENASVCDSEAKEYGYSGYENLLGPQEVEGIPFFGILAGGDWEYPVFFIIYWSGRHLRAYIPKEGNPWNRKQHCAFGGDSDSDIENLRKQLKECLHEEEFEDEHYMDYVVNLFDEEKILKDITHFLKSKEND